MGKRTFFGRIKTFAWEMGSSAIGSTDKQKLAEKNQRLKRLRERLEAKEREISELKDALSQARGPANGSVYPEKVCWHSSLLAGQSLALPG